ncbi:hypothetical protein KKC22_06225, partial [Myxococcota bacterium]|nr:hypothetical protein [Myxococcota bacterium]
MRFLLDQLVSPILPLTRLAQLVRVRTLSLKHGSVWIQPVPRKKVVLSPEGNSSSWESRATSTNAC